MKTIDHLRYNMLTVVEEVRGGKGEVRGTQGRKTGQQINQVLGKKPRMENSPDSGLDGAHEGSKFIVCVTMQV